MASTLCNHSLIHTAKHYPSNTVLLRDYLRDDLSSCSSNGFKSFPRRQCCTTVGFFVAKDLKLQRKRISQRQSTVSLSALQRASGAVMKAIKSLGSSARKGLLSRSFSRKEEREEESQGVLRRRRSFHELSMLDQEHHKATSLSEDSGSSCNSQFLLQGNKEDANYRTIQQPLVTKENWSNEKEQFSPVSIMDCPFEDEDEIYETHFSSTFTVLSFEGVKHKHMQKRDHFESVVSLKPVVLEKRFARLELGNGPHNHPTKQCSPILPIMCTQNSNRDNNHNIEDNAHNLLNFVKGSSPSNNLINKAENLLFDYFKQSIEEDKVIDYSKKLHLCNVVNDWIQEQPQELYLSWEVQGGRCVFIKDMDKCGEWKNSNQEIQQLGIELTNEIFANLVNEFIVNFTSYDTC